MTDIGEERREGTRRRDVTREGGRRETDLLERIRASFPDALECGPECRHARVVGDCGVPRYDPGERFRQQIVLAVATWTG